jgi:DNA-binding MarR family transcriptional regulator
MAIMKKTTATRLARLRSEIALKRDFHGLEEAAFLALLCTWQRLENIGRRFFSRHDITDAQFNALMILSDYRDTPPRQNQLAQLLLVNQASMREVLDRMERSGWIERVDDPDDRRAYRVRISTAGAAKLAQVRPHYYRLLSQLYRGATPAELHAQIRAFDRMRARIRAVET